MMIPVNGRREVLRVLPEPNGVVGRDGERHVLWIYAVGLYGVSDIVPQSEIASTYSASVDWMGVIESTVDVRLNRHFAEYGLRFFFESDHKYVVISFRTLYFVYDRADILVSDIYGDDCILFHMIRPLKGTVTSNVTPGAAFSDFVFDYLQPEVGNRRLMVQMRLGGMFTRSIQ